MDDQHAGRVREAFTEQAAAFEDSAHNELFTSGAAWMLDALPCRGQDIVLDVAAGTALAARSLAGRVRSVIALDATAAMLAEGREAAAREGAHNILFMHGDAEALPFMDASFDIVLSRFALHHMLHPELAITEMVRCTRPGGTVAPADMVADEDPGTAAGQEEIERIRDPSHTRVLALAELTGQLEALGVRPTSVQDRYVERDAGPWLAHAQAGPEHAQRVRQILERGNADTSASSPEGAEQALRFRQRWAAVVGTRD